MFTYKKKMDNHSAKDIDMKRSASELALQDYLTKVLSSSALSRQESILDTSSIDPSFNLMNWDHTCELRDSLLWSKDLIPAGLFRDAQSSICENLSADSPVSANKPEARERARRTSSGSSHDHSEEEDAETEAGQSEMTNDPNEQKRIRSAKTGNQRSGQGEGKQAELVDLESQVDSLKGECSTLYKQLIDATQQFHSAGTNNKILKSEVETLRVKVKLAEDLVARGSPLTSSLNQLLQTHLSPLQHSINSLHYTVNTSPAITVHSNQSLFPGMTLSGRNSSPGLGNVSSEAVSCVSDIWP